jgi:alanyl-tRNA synthetase
VTDVELKEIQRLVDIKIKEDIPVNASQKPIEEAKAAGAMALFGEKYDDIVRVIQIGDFSMELCGGTHVSHTGEIEEIRIVSETGIATGTRRMEAIAGKDNIRHYLDQQRDKLEMTIQAKLKVRNQLAEDLRSLGVVVGAPSINAHSELDVIAEIKMLEKEVALRKSAIASEQSVELMSRFKPSVNGQVLVQRVESADIPMLKELADSLCNLHSNSIVVLGSVVDSTGHWVVKSGATYQSEWTAPRIISELTQLSGGKGGGRPNLAQAGGANPDTMQQAMRHVESVLIP